MRKGQIALILAILLVAGCASHTGQKPSAAVTASAASPSPKGGVADNLTCRLPVTSPTPQEDPAPGGWVTFPGGEFVRDQTSLPGRLATHIPSYDRPLGIWVPVESNNVAPDGATYVLTNENSLPNPSAFYLVDAKTEARRLLLARTGPTKTSSWKVVKYASEGIYLYAISQGMESSVPGLWLLDPQSGSLRLVEGSRYWSVISAGTAWAVDPPAYTPGDLSKVYRLDIATGKVSLAYQARTMINLLSPTPEGDLLIAYGDMASPKLGLLVAPSSFIPIEVPSDFPIYTARLGRPGVWIALDGRSLHGIALYVKGEGVKVMASSTYLLEAVGDCL